MQPIRAMLTADAIVSAGRTMPQTKPVASMVRTPAAADALASLRDLQPMAALDALRGAASTSARSGSTGFDDALRAGRLLRTGDPTKLDAVEQLLRNGVTRAEDVSAPVGAGINGQLHAHVLHDPVDAGRQIVAVSKPVNAQAAQEEYGWKLGRAMGIDHLLAPTARGADGQARIALAPGTSLSQGGVTNVEQLESSLMKSYTNDAGLRISERDAARAARVDRELLQVFDYLGANNDRHLGNGLVDAATGRVTFIDYGHMGTGTGKDALAPSLRAFQPHDRIELSPDTLAILRRRLTPEVLDQVHATLAQGPRPPAGTMSQRMLDKVDTPSFRNDVRARLEHILETGGFASDKTDGVILPPLMEDRMAPRGPHAFMFGGHDGMMPFDRF